MTSENLRCIYVTLRVSSMYYLYRSISLSSLLEELMNEAINESCNINKQVKRTYSSKCVIEALFSVLYPFLVMSGKR